MAQWPSYLTHEIHVKVWVWKRSDSIEQNRKTELTWIMQCHQADFRGVVPRCALVPPGTTYGITVFTTCTVMLTLPSFRIVPRASMLTNAVSESMLSVLVNDTELWSWLALSSVLSIPLLQLRNRGDDENYRRLNSWETKRIKAVEHQLRAK